MARKKKEIVKWDEQMAQFAKATTKGMNLPTAKFLSLKGGRMSFAGADVPGNKLRAIIIGAVFENQMYDPNVPYDAEVAQTPLCFAFGEDASEMSPHEQATEPQCENCEDCPNNEFGSAATGQGKACKNVVRLAIIAEDTCEDIESAEVAYVKIPVMSVRNWISYAKQQVADTLKRPYWSVVTEISTEPDDKSQFRVMFNCAEAIEDSEMFPVLQALWEKTMAEIDFPYIAQERKPAAKKKAVRRGKFATKRKR